jgi:hypothetical protein
MAWVYDSPLNTSEQKIYKVLKRKLKEEDIAKTTVKILSLYGFLKSHNFSSPTQLKKSAFLDKEKTVPVFTDQQAKTVLKSLKKRGGASKYPFTDHVAKKGVDYAITLVPEEVKGTVQSVYDLATSPVRIIEEDVPFGDLLLGALHGATETGVTVAGDVAEGVGGPIGAVMVAPITAMAAGLASLVSLGQKDTDFGQAVAHIANSVPIMGSAIGKGLTQMEHQVENLKKHPDVAEFVPVVGEYITGRPMKALTLENVQGTAKARGISELQRRGIPTSTQEIQAQARARGIAELQKRGIPTTRQEVRSRAASEVQKRLPSVPLPPQVAGKRFSTQRRTYNKWPKTRRSKSAKV